MEPSDSANETLSESVSEPAAGSISGAPEIDQIQILGLIGRGGMGRVYRAKQTLLERVVAVKVPFQGSLVNEKALARFQREAKLSARLNHPNIVKTHGFGVSRDGQPYLVQEYVQGVALTDELQDGKPMKFGRFRQIFLPLLSALEHAHAAGVVHRDIKPDNILLDRSSSTEAVKLLDFGLAILFEESAGAVGRMTQTAAAVGSASYMSPEQCLGKPVDGRADIYSLCCVMYESLCGKTPFQGNSALEIMDKHATAPLPTTVEFTRQVAMPESLSRLILSGLSKSPEKRPDAREFSRRLKKILDDVTLDRAPLIDCKGIKPVGRKTFLIAGVCTVLVGACGLALYWYYSRLNSSNVIAHMDHPQVDDLTLGQLQAKADKLFREDKSAEEFVCRTAVLDHVDKSKKKRTLDFLYCAARAACGAGQRSTNQVVADAYFEKALALCNEAIPLALRERNNDIYSYLCGLKMETLLGLRRDSDLLRYIENTVKQADSLDKATSMSVKLQLMTDLFIKEKPDRAEAILKSIISQCENEFSSFSALALKAKISLVAVYKRKGLLKESKELSMQIGKELIQNHDIVPSTRIDILSSFFCSANDLDPKIRRDFAVNDLRMHSESYKMDPYATARVQHGLACFNQAYLHDLRESIAMEEQSLATIGSLDSRATMNFRKDVLAHLIELCRTEHLTSKEKAYSEMLKQLTLPQPTM